MKTTKKTSKTWTHLDIFMTTFTLGLAMVAATSPASPFHFTYLGMLNFVGHATIIGSFIGVLITIY
jgi:hypothetical protein